MVQHETVRETVWVGAKRLGAVTLAAWALNAAYHAAGGLENWSSLVSPAGNAAKNIAGLNPALDARTGRTLARLTDLADCVQAAGVGIVSAAEDDTHSLVLYVRANGEQPVNEKALKKCIDSDTAGPVRHQFVPGPIPSSK